MTDRELEQKLAAAFTRAAPDDLEAILSRCGAQNGSVMEMKELKENIIDVEVTEVKRKRKLRPWLAAACAALVLLGAGGGGAVRAPARGSRQLRETACALASPASPRGA